MDWLASRSRLLRLLTVLVVLHVCSALHGCPSGRKIAPCTCKQKSKATCHVPPREDGTTVICLDIVCENTDGDALKRAIDHIKEIPNTEIQYMKIRNCVLPRLADYFFMSLTIHHLFILRSGLAVIEDNALTSLAKSLITLDLNSNKIKTIPSDAFRRLHQVRSLNLNSNEIEELPRQGFTGLTNMSRLSLYDNKITTVDDDAFLGLNNLHTLNLMHNQLTKVPANAIKTLRSLERLELPENHIRDIQDNDFQGLESLDALVLENNRVSSLPGGAFQSLTSMTTLNLANNHISYVDDDAFKGLEQTLEWLLLGNNKAYRIPTESLRGLHRLKQLDMQNNNISIVREDAFEGFGQTLKFLNLQKNHIKSIPAGAFIQMHSLEWLQLSSNEISTMPLETVESLLDTVEVIDLYDNPLICNCEMIWFKEWLDKHAEDDEFRTLHHEPHCRKEGSNYVVSVKKLPVTEFNCPNHTGRASRAVCTIWSVGGLWCLLLAADKASSRLAH